MVATPSASSASTPWQRALYQLGNIGLSRSLDGRNDAAAGPSDVLVACPLETHGEFMRTIATVDDVGVAIDQCRRHQPAFKVLGFHDHKKCSADRRQRLSRR